MTREQKITTWIGIGIGVVTVLVTILAWQFPIGEREIRITITPDHNVSEKIKDETPQGDTINNINNSQNAQYLDSINKPPKNIDNKDINLINQIKKTSAAEPQRQYDSNIEIIKDKAYVEQNGRYSNYSQSYMDSKPKPLYLKGEEIEIK